MAVQVQATEKTTETAGLMLGTDKSKAVAWMICNR
jgi:hypothetical protein